MPEAARRVLLYRLGSLGDHLVAFPAYRQVRRAFPGAELCLITNVPVATKAAAAEAVLENSGLVDRFLKYVVGDRNPLTLLKLLRQIRRYRADALVYLAAGRGVKAARRDGIFFRLCGIRQVIGLPVTEDMQKHRPRGVDAKGTPWFEHEGERLARNIVELGDAQTDNQDNWSPNLVERERVEAVRLLEPITGRSFFSFSIGTKAQTKDWTTPNWIALFEALAAEHPGEALVCVGAPDEVEASESVAAAWRNVPGAGPALNLCGVCSPRVSAAVMERSRMFLGHDSGPGHLAASVGVKVLAVHSARTGAGIWFPHGPQVKVLLHWVSCGGCRLVTCIEERKRCILSITVDEVLGTARQMLNQS